MSKSSLAEIVPAKCAVLDCFLLCCPLRVVGTVVGSNLVDQTAHSNLRHRVERLYGMAFRVIESFCGSFLLPNVACC
jgi:hypothetical protein